MLAKTTPFAGAKSPLDAAGAMHALRYASHLRGVRWVSPPVGFFRYYTLAFLVIVCCTRGNSLHHLLRFAGCGQQVGSGCSTPLLHCHNTTSTQLEELVSNTSGMVGMQPIRIAYDSCWYQAVSRTTKLTTKLTLKPPWVADTQDIPPATRWQWRVQHLRPFPTLTFWYETTINDDLSRGASIMYSSTPASNCVGRQQGQAQICVQ